MGISNSSTAMTHLMVPYPAPIRSHEHKVCPREASEINELDQIQAPNSGYYPSIPSDNLGSREINHTHGGISVANGNGHNSSNQVKSNRFAYPLKGSPTRSSLLEEFRNSKNNKKFELKVCCHVLHAITQRRT